jgi:aspartate oxidase
MEELSRRKFLKYGTCLTIGGLATLSPMSSEAHQYAPQKWDETVDIIIIGSGFAGLSAAINLNRKKLGKIAVLEKMQVFGGNSSINGGWLAIPKNPIQLSQGINDDSPAELVKDQIKSGRGMSNHEILLKVANRALDSYNLCINSGVEFRKGFNIQVEGHSKARAIRTLNGTGGDITTRLYDVATQEV